jgi:Tol biopolymer transport system component
VQQGGRCWRPHGRWMVAVLALLAPAMCATTALAAFPGQNAKFVVDRTGSGIATTNGDGTGLSHLTFDFRDHAPAWSPDGTKIVFQRDIWDFDNDQQIGADIVVMNADGSGQTNLTNNPAGEFDRTPTWAPDGARIVFASTSGGQSTIKRINSNGTGETVLQQGGVSPAWSSDDRIAFALNGAIWIMKSNGSQQTQITSGTWSGEPDWSPDATKITYERLYCDASQVCRPEVQIVNADGTDDTRLTNDANSFDDTPVFAPNGSKILWSRWNTTTGATSLVTMNPDGSQQTSLNVDGDRPDWQPVPVNTVSSHIRPKGATPIYASLVPAFVPCGAANRMHGPPLAFDSCNPPQRSSPTVTVGGDTSPALSIGSLRMIVVTGAPGGADDTDVRVRVSITNVIRAANFTEYLGNLGARIGVRLTDKESGISSTTRNFTLGWNVPCFTTADPQLGATCEVDTSLDAIFPGAAVEGSRGVWALDQIQVHDGGPDSSAATEQDNSLFATQGIFVP